MLRIALLLLCLATPLAAQDRAALAAEFARWLERKIWPEAAAQGVSRATFNAALGGVTLDWSLPDLAPPGTAPDTLPQRQAEFRSPARYFRSEALRADTRLGREMAARHAETLRNLSADTGVPGHILLAIWGRESAYGRAPIPENAFRVLATKSFMETRKEMFRPELLAALQIAEAGHRATSDMHASWAGAMGQPQFLPSSYLKFGTDGDGDGHADIWDSVPDTLASIAAYLTHHGWEAGRDWGFEVHLPKGVACTLAGPDQGRPIAAWEALGVTRVTGRPFPDHERDGMASLLLPAGTQGPAFLVTPNFYVLKAYNFSDLYALYVGRLGDRIAFGMGDFRTPWATLPRVTRGEIAELQRILMELGYDTGGADGLIGFKTRRAVGLWQEGQGQHPTCWPETGMVR